MSFTFIEVPESRSQQSGTADDASHLLVFKAVGEQDDYIVHDYARFNTPISVTRPTGMLFRKTISLRPDGWGQYYVDVNYGKLDVHSLPQNSYTFTFDTTGGTVHLEHAQEHRATFPPTAVSHNGSIGVAPDGNVKGTDVIMPKLSFTLAFKFPSGKITFGYMTGLSRATGSTNKYRFLGFEPGEVLFRGANGSDGSQSEMEVNYGFEASQNITDQTVGDITGVTKRGHDVSWIEFGDKVTDGKPTTVATAVHIERVYPEADFDAVFQWNVFTRG